MNGGAGAGASGSSIASIGLQTYATLLKAQGTATANEYQADRLETAAQYGELKATQTSAGMTRNMNNVLGNIQAIRAAANADPNSPTGAAVYDDQERLGDDQRRITVNSIKAQATQSKNDAAFYRQASADALMSGNIAAAAGVASAVAKMTPFGGG
jgi:hypothetical protein